MGRGGDKMIKKFLVVIPLPRQSLFSGKKNPQFLISFFDFCKKGLIPLVSQKNNNRTTDEIGKSKIGLGSVVKKIFLYILSKIKNFFDSK